MKRQSRFRLFPLLLALAMLALCLVAAAEEAPEPAVWQMRCEGTFEVRDPEGEPVEPAEEMTFSGGETVRVGANSRLTVDMDEAHTVILEGSSLAEVVELDGRLTLKLIGGAFLLDGRGAPGETAAVLAGGTAVRIDAGIVFASAAPDENGGTAAAVGVLEGTAGIACPGADGGTLDLAIPAGQITAFTAAEDGTAGETPAVRGATPEDVAGFVRDTILGDEGLTDRVLEGCPNGAWLLGLTGGEGSGDIDAWIVLTAPSDSKVYDGTPLTRTDGVTARGLPQGFSFYAEVSGSRTDAGESANRIATYKIRDAQGEDVTARCTHVRTEEGTLTITPAELVISTPSAEKPYDGTPLLGGEATVTGLVNGETITVTAAGITDAGTADNTYAIEWGGVNSANYTITEEIGTLTVTPAELVISTPSAEKPYDGTPLLGGEATVTGLVNGETITVFTDTLTNVGSVPNTYEIDWGGTDPDNYTITEDIGTLEVTENDTPITFTAGSGKKPYDGTPLTVDTVTVSGLPEGFTYSAQTSGSRTIVGTGDNFIDTWSILDAEGEDVTVFFTGITKENGTLEVTPNTTPITFTADSGEKPYDGTALKVDTVTVSGLPNGFTFIAEASGSRTDAGTGASTVTSYVILDTDGGDVTACFSGITTVDGTLTVTPAELTVTTGSAEKVYDGMALTNDEASLTGLVAGDTATVTATGTITKAGGTSNTYEINWGATNPDNYAIVEDLGTLTVKQLQLNFAIGDNSYTYGTDKWSVPYATVTLTIGNGPRAGETVLRTSRQINTNNNDVVGQVMFYTLFTGDAISYRIGGMDHDADTYTVSGEVFGVASSPNTDLRNFNVTGNTANWTVTPRQLTISTSSASKTYDGEPLTSSGVTVEGLTDADAAKVTVTATGAITKAGETPNTYSIEWGGVNPGNYTIVEDLGTLTVEQLQLNFAIGDNSYTYGADLASLQFATVTLTIGNGPHAGETVNHNSRQFVRQGADNTLIGQTMFYKLFTGDSISFAVRGADHDADTYTMSGRVNPGNFDTDKQNFNVTCNTANWTVTPRQLTISTSSASKPYDGEPLTSSGVTVEGLTDFDAAKVTVTATGTITKAGETPNTYEIDWGGVDPNNYTIVEDLGTLTVTGSGGSEATAGMRFNRATNKCTYTHSNGTVSTHTILDYDKAREMYYQLLGTGVSLDAIFERLVDSKYIGAGTVAADDPEDPNAPYMRFDSSTSILTYRHSDGTVTTHEILNYDNAYETYCNQMSQNTDYDSILTILKQTGYIK